MAGLAALGAAVLVLGSVTFAPPASAEASTTVGFTQIGIYPRSGPSMGADKVGDVMADGTPVTVVCETEAEPVSNGYETISIWDRLEDGRWLPNAFLATGTTSWTPGVPQCEDSDASESTTEGAPSTPVYDDPCMAAWPGGFSSTEDIFGGTQTTYDAQMSNYLVCAGFGAGPDVEYSDGMKCAMVAAATTMSAVPGAGQGVSQACDAAALADEGLGAIPGVACGILGDSFATGVGIAAAGASAETGPGAVAVGTTTYRYFSVAAELTCGALFDDGAYDFGTQLEADHEARVAADVRSLGKCLRTQTRFGSLNWSAADC